MPYAYDEEDDPIEEDLAGSDWQPASAVADLGVTDPIIDDFTSAPPSAADDFLTPVEGPDEFPGDRTPGTLTPYDDEPLPAADAAPPIVAQAAPSVDLPSGLDPATGAPVPEVPPVAQLAPVSFAPTPVETDSIAKPEMPSGSRLKVTQTVQSPEQNAVNADAAKLAEQKVIAENNASLVRQQQIKDQEEIAAKQTALAVEKKARTEALLKDHDDRLAAATARNEQALANYQGAKFHDFWSDKTTGDRVIGALAVFLGGLGTAFGGENTAMKNLNSLIQRDYERQKEEIGQKFALYGETSKNLDRAQELKAHAITDLNLRFAAATEATAAQLAQMKLKQNLPAEVVQRDKNVLEIYEKANVFKQQSAKDTNAMVEWDTYNKAKTGGGGGGGSIAPIATFIKEHPGDQPGAYALAEKLGYKGQKAATLVDKLQNDYKSSLAPGGAGGKPTDAQQKAAVYGRAIEDAVKQVGNAAVLTPEILAKFQRNSLQSEAADASASKGLLAERGVALARWAGGVAKSKYDGIPEAAQVVLNQIDVAKESLARVHSGGAIPTAEDRAFADLWAPKSGDSPKLISQKLRQMDTEAKRLLALSGSAAALTEGITSAAPGPARAPSAPKADTDEIRNARLRQASEAIKPNSGATPAQREKAKKLLLEAGAR